MKKTLLPIILALSFVLLAGCVLQGIEAPKDMQFGDKTNTIQQNDKTGQIDTEQQVALDAPKKFESVEQLKQYLADNTISNSNYGRDKVLYGAPAPMGEAINFIEGVVGTKTSSDSDATGEYSQTNVQVQGVDEADFVKTDGNYIYLISNEKLIIVDAKDPQNAQIIFEQKIFDSAKDHDYTRPTPEQMFIDGDNLAIFASVPRKEIVFDKYDITPKKEYKTYTGLYVFDISDPKNPQLKTNISVLGDYYQSRMINDTIYFVSQYGAHNDNVYPPVLYEDDIIFRPDIYYFDTPQEQYVFNTITSYDLSKQEMIDSKSYLMGYSSTLMMSQDNMYIAYQKRDSWCRWCYYDHQYEKQRFDEVIMPKLPAQLQGEIKTIYDSTGTEGDKWQKVSERLKEYFAPALADDKEYYSKETVEQRQNLLEQIEDALTEYDAKKQIEKSKTIIHKFRVNNGTIQYVAQGSVNGYLLNQFSMDEYNGDLRVATTVDVWAQKRIQYNNVFVLDENMDTIGSIEKIAKDEKIYSARFMGKRLYLVTFKQIDPFLAIDLSEPTEPKVLGELKIPGYSSYLHPYSEDIIIGIGKETKETQWGGTSTAGVKVSLFNVADPANPKEIDKMEFGDSGSDSAVLHDHKAFLLDTRNDLMVLPLKVVRREKGFFADKTSTWDGAAVVKVTKDGFEQYGLVKHNIKEDYWGGWWSSSTVRRSLYIDSALYTISDSKILVNEIATDMPQLSKINLEQDDSGLIPVGDNTEGSIIPQIKLPFFE